MITWIILTVAFLVLVIAGVISFYVGCLWVISAYVFVRGIYSDDSLAVGSGLVLWLLTSAWFAVLFAVWYKVSGEHITAVILALDF